MSSAHPFHVNCKHCFDENAKHPFDVNCDHCIDVFLMPGNGNVTESAKVYPELRDIGSLAEYQAQGRYQERAGKKANLENFRRLKEAQMRQPGEALSFGSHFKIMQGN